MKLDYIIVGQGLAGSILAYTLIRNQKSVLVYDDPHLPKASNAAAGIYNPFTGRQMARTWMLDELFPYLQQFYRDIEQHLGIDVMQEVPMYRPFLSQLEQNEWGSKAFQQGYQTYIEDVYGPTQAPDWVRGAYGGMLLKGCGYVNARALINAISSWLQHQNCRRAEAFNYSALHIAEQSVTYQEVSAKKIIFCEGPNLEANPYFKGLPLRPVKGETLDVQITPSLPYTVNRGIFALPMTDNTTRIGSTFNHHDLSWECTDEGRQELEAKLQKLIAYSYKVLGQNAGIRPATADRKPLIGLHPEFEPLGVFNGLGTKGISLAPYWAQEFFKFLELGRPLLQEVSINRYF